MMHVKLNTGAMEESFILVAQLDTVCQSTSVVFNSYFLCILPKNVNSDKLLYKRIGLSVIFKQFVIFQLPVIFKAENDTISFVISLPFNIQNKQSWSVNLPKKLFSFGLC